jgi:hypothetical protein
MRRTLAGVLVIAVPALAAAQACSRAGSDEASGQQDVSTSQPAETFDVDDVSILFPIKGRAPYPEIHVGSDSRDDPQLWPKDLFDQVIAKAHENGIQSFEQGSDDFFSVRDLWRVVGVRFDPCAPGLNDAVLDSLPGAQKGQCTVQLRLVAEPFRGDADTTALADDFGAHLVYNVAVVPKSELAANPMVRFATQLLGQIKAESEKLQGGATSGRTLGVHPGLAAESKGDGARIAALVKTLVQSLTNTPSRLITLMAAQPVQPWLFMGGQVDGGQFTLLPSTGGSPNPQAFGDTPDIGQGPDDPNQPGLSVTPPGTAAASTTPFLVAGAKATDAQKVQVFAVEDPNTTSIANTDCVSCHTSSASAVSFRGPELARRARVPKNVTGYVAQAEQQDAIWNVHNFGYFGSKPTVSGRTVNESALVAAWLNENVRAPGVGVRGPGPDCTAVDDAVWTCFADGKPDCLAKCASGPTSPAAPSPSPTIPPVPLRPSGTPGDPCATADVGGPPTVTEQPASLNPSVGGVIARLGGNNGSCLSRLLGGGIFTFQDGSMSVDCTLGALPQGPCAIVMTSPTDVAQFTLTGAEMERFKQKFRVEDGRFFQSRGGPAAVLIGCTKDHCVVEVAPSPEKLPAQPGERLNP